MMAVQNLSRRFSMFQLIIIIMIIIIVSLKIFQLEMYINSLEDRIDLLESESLDRMLNTYKKSNKSVYDI